ncbi:MAG: hypothetical protein WB630_24800 [Candidatus Acidiferrales bacterium]
MTKSVVAVIFGVGSAAWAQSQGQQNSTNETAITTAQTYQDNLNPVRTTQSQSKSGNQSVDKQSVEVLGPDGRYQPSFDTETETVQVNDTTTRTVVRTYNWDANGRRKLVEIREQETRTTASGDAQTMRTTSNSDLDGNLFVVLREVEDTRKTSPDAQETKTTVYAADGNGGFTAARQTDEVQQRNADRGVEVHKTTLRPDANGNLRLDEVSRKTVKEEDKTRITEERISRTDLNGKLSEVARTVGQETETPAGSQSTVDTYSVDIPGVSREGNLHLGKRVITVERKDSDGETTEQQVERPDIGNPSDGLQPSAKTKYIVRYSFSGAQQTSTTRAPDGNGTWSVVSVETKEKEPDAPR